MARRLIGLAVVAAIFWSAWWILAAVAVQLGADLWLQDRRIEGWVADVGAVEVTGYPSRFRIDIAAPDLADPETGLAWSAPRLVAETPAWQPADVTLTFPAEQTVATPRERLALTTDSMVARLALVPGRSLTLLRAEASVAAAEVVSSLGWQAAVAEARLSAVRPDDAATALDLRADAAQLAPAAPVLGRLDPAGRLPRTVELVAVDARVDFDRPWDRRAVEERRPQPVRIDLRRAKATWGIVDIEAAGNLVIDAEGVPEGALQVRAVNWREILAVATDAGLLGEDLAATVERGLEFVAGASGNPETIELPLGFRDGRISLGPIPLGPAPSFRIR